MPTLNKMHAIMYILHQVCLAVLLACRLSESLVEKNQVAQYSYQSTWAASASLLIASSGRAILGTFCTDFIRNHDVIALRTRAAFEIIAIRDHIPASFCTVKTSRSEVYSIVVQPAVTASVAPFKGSKPANEQRHILRTTNCAKMRCVRL
jgi:hypothetical protein